MGNGAVGHLTLSPKRTGKTVFLQAFSIVVVLLFTNLRVIYINYSSWAGREEPITPAEMLYNACRFNPDLAFNTKDMQHVCNFVFAANSRL